VNEIKISLPLTEKTISSLKSGAEVLLSGIIYTARDAAHKRFAELIAAGKPLPIDINNQILYYVGPTPAPKGKPIGSAGPTTSDRMDAFTPLLLEHGLKGMIGKGPRAQAVKDSIVKNKAVYFAAIGGAGALLSQCITAAEVIAFPELGTEAMHKLTIKDFPVIVINDIYGNDLYQQR
jgi:fumarate hydratase subunit beta